MMPRNPLKRARLIGEYVTGAHRVATPSALMIETTVRCNLLCPMCPRTGAGYPNEDLPDEMLWPLLEDFAALGGDHVYLYGLGEPFMDARIFDLLARCRDLGLGTVLSSNATFLDAERRARLLDVGCDHLILGLDGASEETYRIYRKGGRYDRVIEHITSLAAEKTARGGGPTIVVQFIRMKHNRHETQAFLDRWGHVEGIDEVRIKDEDIGLPEHRTYESGADQRFNPCHILWRGPMIVRYNGDVFPCYHIADQGSPLGNLRDASLEDLWNGPEMQRLRELHADRRHASEPLCATCPCTRPRLPFILGAMAVRGTTSRRLVPVAERLALRLPGIFQEPRKSLLDG